MRGCSLKALTRQFNDHLNSISDTFEPVYQLCMPFLRLHEAPLGWSYMRRMLEGIPPFTAQKRRMMAVLDVADSVRFWITLTVESMLSKEISKPIHVSPGLQQQLCRCLIKQTYSS